jgi:PAS domain S-box-containing protein
VIFFKRETRQQRLSPQDTKLLLQGNERFELIIKNLTQYALVTLDKEGVIQNLDAGAEEMLHYTKEEARGKPFSIFFTEHDIARGEDRREIEYAEKYGFAEDDRWHRRKDNTFFWGSGIMTTLLVEGVMVGFVKIFRDRTLHAAQEQRKEDFVGIAGHELRNPLAILKSNIELVLLQPEVEHNPELTEIHKSMNEQVNRLTHLVDDLLDLSKIASGQLRPKKERLNLKKLIEEVGYDYQKITISHAIALMDGEETEVFADRSQITQVLNNLISNAIKYSPNADRVEISLYNRPQYAEVWVRDFGIGISDKEKNKIFERFYRVDNKHQTAMGLGIGLYVCLEIIKAHGGSMGVESIEGEGSKFYFTLPKE